MYKNIHELDGFATFDIETTGLHYDDKIISFTIHDDGMVSWVNEEDHSLSTEQEEQIENQVEDEVNVVEVENEKRLLEEVREFVSDLSRDTALVAYFGETWRSGFDVSFIRTRCSVNNVEFPFLGQPYMDLNDVFEDKERFNTTRKEISVHNLNKGPLQEFVESTGIAEEVEADILGFTRSDLREFVEDYGYDEEELEEFLRERDKDIPSKSGGGLCEVHDLLVGNNGDDPYDDSEETVEAYEEGDWVTVVTHNIADVRKTRNLLEECLRMGVGEKAYNLKKFPRNPLE